MNTLKLAGMTALGLVLSACGGSSSNSSTTTPPPVNAAPVANDGSETLLQNSDAISFTLAATDADGDTLTYSIGTQPTSGTISLSGNVAAYTPDTDFSGADSFTFTANDGTVNSNVATVSLTVEPTSSFTGRLTKVDGTVIPNITVEALDTTGDAITFTTSDSDGVFTLTAVTEQDLVLNLLADDYANQVLPVTMPALKSINLPLDITLIERGAEQTIDIDAGGTLSGNDGASVTLNSGSFVDSSGAIVTGNITARITPVDISNPQILAAFPGDFTGIEEVSGTLTTIASLGTVEYTFTQNGQALQLGSGATADIELPIYDATNPQTGNPVEMGDIVELWSLNEDTGIWLQEGTGTIVANTASPTGLALKATVSHFTWWNVDYPVDVAGVDITLSGNVDGGVAIIHARVENFPGFRTANANVVVGSTTSGLVIPQNQTTCFWVEYLDITGATANSNEQCINNAVAGSTYPLTFNVLTTGSLTLRAPYTRSNYFIGKPISIGLSPLSLETAVSYTVTSGALPAGMNLTTLSSTSAAISGTPTELGSFSATITGTDSDNFMDIQIVSFSIVDTPPPSLKGVATIYANSGESISRTIPISNNGADAPTSWIVTQSDGSPVPAGVSISSSGVFSIANYDGLTASYSVTAYNAKGASNSVILQVRDLAISPPVLPPAYQITFITGEGTISENLSGLNSGAPATSWTITNPDGNAAPSDVVITNAGVVSLSESNAIGPYEVKAFNGTNASDGMELTFFEDISIPPGCTDPNDPFC